MSQLSHKYREGSYTVEPVDPSSASFFPEAIASCALRHFKKARKLDKFVQNSLYGEGDRRDNLFLGTVWRRIIRSICSVAITITTSGMP